MNNREFYEKRVMPILTKDIPYSTLPWDIKLYVYQQRFLAFFGVLRITFSKFFKFFFLGKFHTACRVFKVGVVVAFTKL
jgi:hypothetical protein